MEPISVKVLLTGTTNEIFEEIVTKSPIARRCLWFFLISFVLAWVLPFMWFAALAFLTFAFFVVTLRVITMPIRFVFEQIGAWLSKLESK